MELNNIASVSLGLGLMLNSFAFNKYIATTEIDKCAKINAHLGTTAFFIAGAIKTYKAIRG